MWKWIMGLVMLLGLGFGAAYVFKPELLTRLGIGGDTSAQPASATPVQFEPAEKGDLVRTVAAPGTIEPVAVVSISSQVSAIITALPYREGQTVNAGDVVVRLDPQTLVARLASAEASLRGEEARLKGSEADMITSRLEFERIEQLFETGDAAKAELEQAEASYLRAVSSRDSLRASIEIARAGIDEVEEDLGNTVIESPRAGVITALNSEVGETAIVGTTNNPGSVLMEIADLSSMILKAQVDETNIAPVRVGQRATIYVNAFPDREFRGTVERIGLKRRAGDSGTGYFDVEIRIDLAEGDTLYSGLTASCDIEVEPFFDVVKVPSQAVVDRRVDELPPELRSSPLIEEGATYAQVVFTLDADETQPTNEIRGEPDVTPVSMGGTVQPAGDDGQPDTASEEDENADTPRSTGGEARPIIVKTGASDLTHTVIVEGLEPGTSVVAGPYRTLTMIRPGMRIIDEKDAPPSAFAGGEFRRSGGRRGRGGWF